MVPGRPLRSSDRWRELAPALSALHQVPADQAARILRIEPTVEAWHCRYVQFRCALEQVLYPRLSASVISTIDEQYC